VAKSKWGNLNTIVLRVEQGGANALDDRIIFRSITVVEVYSCRLDHDLISETGSAYTKSV
jgi:hypothetical protein